MERKELEQLIEKNRDTIDYMNYDNEQILDYLFKTLQDCHYKFKKNVPFGELRSYQTIVALEELGELQQAISKVSRSLFLTEDQINSDLISYKDTRKIFKKLKEFEFNLNEEVADVIFNLVRLSYLYSESFDSVLVKEILIAKLEYYKEYTDYCCEKKHLF